MSLKTVVSLLSSLEAHFLTHSGELGRRVVKLSVLLSSFLLSVLYSLSVLGFVPRVYFDLIVGGVSGVVSFLIASPLLLFSLVIVGFTVYYLYVYYSVFTGGVDVSGSVLVMYYVVSVLSMVLVGWVGLSSLGVVELSVSVFFVLYVGSLLCGVVISQTAFSRASSVMREQLREQDVSFAEASAMDGLPVTGFYPNVWRYAAVLSVVLSVLYSVLYFAGFPLSIVDSVFFLLPSIVNTVYFVRLELPRFT